MANRQKIDYFDRLTKQSEYSLKASEVLSDFLVFCEMSDIFGIRSSMQELKNLSLSQSKEILSSLTEDFLPPFDREDIFLLSDGILKVTETFCDAFQFIYTYNNTEFKGTAKFARIASECCFTMHSAVSGLKNCKKRGGQKSFFEEITALKAKSDEEYFRALSGIYSETADARKAFFTANVYNSIRKCCDTCIDTVILIETAVMKNV